MFFTYELLSNYAKISGVVDNVMDHDIVASGFKPYIHN